MIVLPEGEDFDIATEKHSVAHDGAAVIDAETVFDLDAVTDTLAAVADKISERPAPAPSR
jgi:hypothetical protein